MRGPRPSRLTVLLIPGGGTTSVDNQSIVTIAEGKDGAKRLPDQEGDGPAMRLVSATSRFAFLHLGRSDERCDGIG